MNSKGFQLDFEHGVLKINEEEVVLHGRTEERVRVILAEDTSIAERCEEIINGYPDGRFDDGRIMMLEPGTHDSDVGHGVVIGKSLIHVAEMVPVRVMNVNYHSVVLRKGTVLGYCCPVTSIVRRVNIAGIIPNQKISPELETLFETSAIGLKKDQKISIVMGRELRLPCDLKFGCPPGEDLAGEDYVTTLRRKMDDIHDRVRVNIQVASDRMKEAYDMRAEGGGYQAGDVVWLYNPQRRRGLSPKLQNSWEDPYEILARISDVIYRIKKSSGGKPRVVHFNRLTPFAGNNHDASVRTMTAPTEMSFEEFMSEYSTNRKVRYGVTSEEQRDLFQVPNEFALAHCVAQDLKMSRGIAATFKQRFGRVDELRDKKPEVGEVVQLGEDKTGRNIFYLITKELSYQQPTYQDVWASLVDLRDALLSQNITKLAIPKLACGLEVIFRFTGIKILDFELSP
ncbi:hypothetical protein NQ315_003580 [Exocentrus adspersus]|uniref:Integrase p58-like C-terminal domain-containing protein n=1 Tax=Exocentrus adspersus TaxID=1586481 RepID=A0AAV8VA49_9CUCU|nr:hypothetical protein NQ315_003580 [Exocentrus adspersus]